MEDVLDISSDNLALLREEAKMADSGQLMRYIRVFSELSNQIRYAAQKRVMIEIALIKLCKPEMERDIESLALRIAQLEQKLEDGISAALPQESVQKGRERNTKDISENPQEAGQKDPKIPKVVPEDIQQVVKNWRSIIEELPGGLKNYLKLARPTMTEEGQLLLILEDEVAEAFVNTEDHLKELGTAIGHKMGKEIPFKIAFNDTNRPFEESYVDLGKVINMEITIEDQEDM